MKKCINCRHRTLKEGSSYCDISGHFLHYSTVFEHWCRHWAEVKIIGECKFADEITEMPEVINLGDIKFLDEDGNEVELNPTLWETPPPLVKEYTGTLTIYFPEGRTIENPSPEEFLEWAKGTQIPIYYVDESEDKE